MPMLDPFTCQTLEPLIDKHYLLPYIPPLLLPLHPFYTPLLTPALVSQAQTTPTLTS